MWNYLRSKYSADDCITESFSSAHVRHKGIGGPYMHLLEKIENELSNQETAT